MKRRFGRWRPRDFEDGDGSKEVDWDDLLQESGKSEKGDTP
jgi:hypothetical protein